MSTEDDENTELVRSASSWNNFKEQGNIKYDTTHLQLITILAASVSRLTQGFLSLIMPTHTSYTGYKRIKHFYNVIMELICILLTPHFGKVISLQSVGIFTFLLIRLH